jgi:hypothetical protein
MKTLLYFITITILLCLNLKAQSFGNALQFDGVNDYVDIGNASTFNVETAVTYEAWIKPDTSLSGYIFRKVVAFAEDKHLVFSRNRIHFYLYDVFGGTNLASSPSIPIHQYTHVAATYNTSTGTASLYINGAFDTSKSVGSGVSNSTGNLYYGFSLVASEAPFKGIIDEVRIWNVARTESEIQSTMNQTLNGNEAGLIGYWKFDEGTGTVTRDATSSHNDGTINGAAWVISGVLPVEHTIDNIPKEFSLEQNYPNPFNPVTTIQYSIPKRSNITLKVYDVLGNEVATLIDEYRNAGFYEIEINGSNLSSGVYFYRIQAGDFVDTKKMILIK